MNTTIKAAFWMIGAIVSFTSMAVAGRTVSDQLDTFEIMLFRSLIGLCLVLGGAVSFGTIKQVNCRQLGLHGLRNIAHFTGQNLWFYAITVIPLTQVFALEFTSPIWALLLAPLVLKEPITRRGMLAAGIGFAGILIITRPGGDVLSASALFGTVSAVVAAIGFAFSALFTRRLTRTQTITCILFWLTLMQLCFGIIAAGWDGDIAQPSPQAAPWVAVIGGAGLLAHFCLTRALSLAPATIVMPIDFIRLPVIGLVAAWLYGEPMDVWVFIGAVLIFWANFHNIAPLRGA